MANRDTSKDGLSNKIQTFLLTNFPGIWEKVQNNSFLSKKVNQFLINSAIYKIPTRPYPYSLITLEPYIPETNDPRFQDIEGYVEGKGLPKKTDTYSSWDSLIDRTYTGRHLPPDPAFNQPDKLPKLEELAVLFKKENGKTIDSEKSTLLFPYFVQWFTDGFLRTDPKNKLKILQIITLIYLPFMA
jgi:prostaglandin-endoperoxide synthase 2